MKISQTSKCGDNLFKWVLYNINKHRFHVCSPNIVTATLRPTQQAECDTTDTRVLLFSPFITTLLPLSHCPSSPPAGFWFRWRTQDGDWGKCFVRVGNVHYCPIICCPASLGSCLIPPLWFLLHCHRYTRRKNNLSPFALNVDTQTFNVFLQ